MSDNPESSSKGGQHKLRPWRRRLNTIGGLAILGSMAYCTGLYATAESRVSRVCAKFTRGMDLPTATTIAKSHDMNAPRDAPVTFVAEIATFGRHACKLEFKEGILERSTYGFQD
jgi:hypothetical protein